MKIRFKTVPRPTHVESLLYKLEVLLVIFRSFVQNHRSKFRAMIINLFREELSGSYELETFEMSRIIIYLIVLGC
jgi:hypothetical protein